MAYTVTVTTIDHFVLHYQSDYQMFYHNFFKHGVVETITMVVISSNLNYLP
jgi:hypothetical protein